MQPISPADPTSGVSLSGDFGQFLDRLTVENAGYMRSYEGFQREMSRHKPDPATGMPSSGYGGSSSDSLGGNPYMPTGGLMDEAYDIGASVMGAHGQGIAGSVNAAAETIKRSTALTSDLAIMTIQKSNVLMYGSMFNNFVKSIKTLFTGQ